MSTRSKHPDAVGQASRVRSGRSSASRIRRVGRGDLGGYGTGGRAHGGDAGPRAGRPEILPDGEPADPNTDPPADTLDRARALSEAWARWLEVDQAAELAADPALIADVAGFLGAEQYTRHYTRLAATRADAGTYDRKALALRAALLAIDLHPDVAHTISWRRGGAPPAGSIRPRGPSSSASPTAHASCGCATTLGH